ncbi:MAG: ABC transporter permease, partial [Mesotoga sp.]|nr:ABC transporter permease [Mesotoga sp.]MDD4825718.1 ABC transporter permease [Mesotoga sp.]
MFWKYMLKRVFYGIFIYIILIFVFSALFNTVMEQTLRGQIDEEIRAELMALDNVGSQQIQNFIEMRRAEKFALYKLDKPIFERIVWRTWSTLTLNLGKSSSIRSAAGDRNVWAIVSEKIPRTLILFSSAMLIDIIIGIWLGLKKAQKAGGVLDKSTSV